MASLIGSITFIFCSPTTSLIFVKVVPIQFLAWCLLPIILYILIKFIIAFQNSKSSLLFYSILLCVIIILLIKWSHTATIVSYGMAFLIFLIPIVLKAPAILKPLFLIFVLCFAFSLDKFYILLTELLISQENQTNISRTIQYTDFDCFSLWSVFLKPFVPITSKVEFIVRNVTFGDATDPFFTKVIFFGPPYAVLTLYGIFSKKVQFKFKSSLVSVICASFVMMFMPFQFHEFLILPSANFLWKDSLILFSIIIGSITLGSILKIYNKKKYLLFASLSLLQCATLILGTSTYIIHGIKFNRLGHQDLIESSKKISDFIEKKRLLPNSLTAITYAVEKKGPQGIRGWAGEMNNSLAIWKTPLLNGYLKFFDMNRVSENTRLGTSQIRGLKPKQINQNMLNILGIEFLFLSNNEFNSDEIVELEGIQKVIDSPNIKLYQNTKVWDKINFFDKGFLKNVSKKKKNHCGNNDLFCYDFSEVHSSRFKFANIKISSTRLGKYEVIIDPLNDEKSGLLTESFRDEWEGAADGKKINLYRTLNNFIGFDIPPNTRVIKLEYKPKLRILFSIMQNIFLIMSFVYCIFFLIKQKNRNINKDYNNESSGSLLTFVKFIRKKNIYSYLIKFSRYQSSSWIRTSLATCKIFLFILNVTNS